MQFDVESCIDGTQQLRLLRVKVVIGQLKVVVVTELPEDSPRGFMSAPLDK